MVAGLGTAGRRAADAGVLLGVEPLNRFETDVCQHRARTRSRSSSASAITSVGVMLDTFHMNMEEFDIADAIRRDRLPARALPGQREQSRLRRLRPHRLGRRSARALRDVGYAGPIVLEPFRRNDERAGVPLAQWRAPTTDEDGDARRQHRLSAATLAFARGA